MKPLDYSLYNKVKEKFPPQELTVIFVSLAPQNIERLEAVAYKVDEVEAFVNAVGDHVDKLIPYAVIGGLEGDGVGFFFACHEFMQEEDLLEGKIVSFSLGSYHHQSVNIEAVKKDMQKLTQGTLLVGNA